MRNTAIAPGLDGALWPYGEVYATDPDTMSLFEAMKLQIPFLAEETVFEPLEDRNPPLMPPRTLAHWRA